MMPPSIDATRASAASPLIAERSAATTRNWMLPWTPSASTVTVARPVSRASTIPKPSTDSTDGAEAVQVRGFPVTGAPDGSVTLAVTCADVPTSRSVPIGEETSMVATVIVSGLVALVAFSLPHNLGLVVASLAGIFTGIMVETWRGDNEHKNMGNS